MQLNFELLFKKTYFSTIRVINYIITKYSIILGLLFVDQNNKIIIIKIIIIRELILLSKY